MLIPLLAWGSFFLALLIPGTGVEDVPGELPRVVGLPLNLFVGLMIMLLAVLAWSLSVSSHNAQEAARRRQAVSSG